MDRLIAVYAAAPAKPVRGAPCNGCGVCCAVVLCPLARIVFRRIDGPCPALEWDGAAARYVCGLVAAPHRHLGWLPRSWSGPVSRLCRRWMAIGSGCDSDAEIG